MTETTELPTSASTRARRGGDGLSGMVLADLKALAAQLGIKGTSGLRKGDLVSAIAARQGAPANGTPTGGAAATSRQPTPARTEAPADPPVIDHGDGGTGNGAANQRGAGNGGAGNGAAGHGAARDQATETGAPAADGPAGDRGNRARRGDERSAESTLRTPASSGSDDAVSGSDGAAAPSAAASAQQDQVIPAATGASAPSATEDEDGSERAGSDRSGEGAADSQRTRRNRRGRRNDNRTDRPEGGESRADGATGQPTAGDGTTRDAGQAATNGAARDGSARDGSTRDGSARDGSTRDGSARDSRREQNRDNQNGRDQNRDGGRPDNRSDARSDRSDNRSDNRGDLDDDGAGGRRGRRFRDRNRRTRERFTDTPDTEVRDDDVLVPVAGIVDVLDSYAFIRTSGYLSGPNDVYVSLSQVRKNGLRRGDAVTGAVRAPREGEAARQKFNALVRLDSVNGLDPEQARNRPEFTKLTPLYPNERLRLETESHLLTTRVIDLVMPVGKGQRALIVSPPKAGKTMVMQAIANAITTNNPECHLMVVLVDERPEEVTDMQRSVRGEVIASTFDRPPADHTMVAELSIERAKRLVEMGRDVVVLLDSITRLGRAYNLAAPASGRILSGGVDSTALFPPKRFLGAARNIENGGSLTIFASALVETGSAGDTVIFEEFKGTGNAELKLDRKLADKRIFPAIDVDQSSTRKEDLLLVPDELAVTVKLRRILAALDAQQALELVLGQLRKTRNNVEFLMQVAKNTPGNERD